MEPTWVGVTRGMVRGSTKEENFPFRLTSVLLPRIAQAPRTGGLLGRGMQIRIDFLEHGENLGNVRALHVESSSGNT